jgi:hypothetical protein
VLLRYALLAGAVLAATWLVYFARVTLSMPYPIEYREGAAQVMTQFLVHGQNPFTLENQPLGMNNYGILYAAIVWPLAALFGNTLLIHRAVSFAFILLTGGLVYQAIHKSSRDAGMAAACAALAAIALATRGGLGAFPSSAGTFIFMAALLIPAQRSFSCRSLMFSALLGLLAFYTKPYFVLCFGTVATYVFIFVSRRRALLYAAVFIALFAAAFFVVRAWLPLYFVDVLASNLSNTTRVPEYLVKQLRQLLKEFYPAALLGIIALVAAIPALRARGTRSLSLLSPSKLAASDRPVLSTPLDYFAYAFVVSTAAFIFVLGLHVGNYMAYAYQLMLPPFVIWLGRLFARPGRWVWIQVPLLILNLFTFSAARLDPAFLSQGSARPWARLYEYVDRSTRVLNSPVLVPEMIRRDMPVLDSGQTEYFYNVNRELYPGNNLLGPSYETLAGRGQQYLSSVNDAIANQAFDAIMVTDQLNIFDQNLMSRYYQPTLSMAVNMPQTDHEWTIDVWTPIPK